MEGNRLSSRNMMQGNVSFGGFDLQEPIRVHHHQQQQPQQFIASHHGSHPRQGPPPLVSTNHKKFPLVAGGGSQVHDHTVSLSDLSKHEKSKSASEEDEPSFAEEISESRKGKKASSPWQRVKWTDEMVRLLITAVSYINEEAVCAENSSIGSRRKHANLQKKGKWKSVSKVLAERGFFVSPQQCEDKFNDLNKRYKRLNEILGRGTCCEVVENPSLLEVVDHIPEKAKEEVRKILSSKHLHYEEMCSYHNGNRLYLPHDPELQRSLHLALGTRDDHEEHDSKCHPLEDNDEFDHQMEYDDHEDSGEAAAYGMMQNLPKRTRSSQGPEDFSLKKPPPVHSLDCNKIVDYEGDHVSPEGMEINSVSKKQWISQRSVQLEEQRLQIETRMLELEKERFKWQRFCRKKDRELDFARMEIERMKLANERMALELKKKEMELNSN